MEEFENNEYNPKVCRSEKCSKDSFIFFILFLVMIGICIFILYLTVKEKNKH